MGVQAVGTEVFGTIPKDSVGLVLGRSSSVLKGIKVLPGIIDGSHLGEIKVMVEDAMGVLVIPHGERIAQLVLLCSFHSANLLSKQV